MTPAQQPHDRRLAATVTAHATATLVMVGLIWVVQFVHYPLFDKVGDENYPAF